METLSIIGLIVFCFCIYFLPAIVACRRNHRQAAAIILLDLFLGWSLIGWVAALVWAATSDVEPKSNAGEWGTIPKQS